MRFSTLALLTSALTACTTSAATTWNDYLQENVLASRQAFETKLTQCTEGQPPLKKIEAPWFAKLSNAEKYAAAVYLNTLLTRRCVGETEGTYSRDLFAYAAEFGKNDNFTAWEDYQRVYRADDTLFETLNVQPVLDYFDANTELNSFKILPFLEQYQNPFYIE
ncbi:hypothetical protein LRP50_14380 [Enterovibrio sp. ZSDZ42]|uniref:Lipoprotein n=1 Tax=Enterovibrio gelatinilyticus TaxID=2899819 RepID=A0ABT5R2T8_9GAMM|nr:hypothetical protein [Enterovibrio sp. ZSDZ42]MDD1794324.1 hypothetical protein [Enterovibrio sp. ZSDZ42]